MYYIYASATGRSETTEIIAQGEAVDNYVGFWKVKTHFQSLLIVTIAFRLKQPYNYKLTARLFNVYFTRVFEQPYTYKLIARVIFQNFDCSHSVTN